MTDWNPNLYLKFGSERTLPSIDLISRIPSSNPQCVIDLGCGPGNSTSVLRERWPNANLTGVDSSQNMIDIATTNYPTINWALCDISEWVPEKKYDVIFSNAALQWVPNHHSLFRSLMGNLAKGGVLATQVPYHYESPLHQAIVGVSKDNKWSDSMNSARKALTHESASFYYDALNGICTTINIWETEYYHIMESPKAILDWISSTGLRPFVEVLPLESDRKLFSNMVLEKYEKAYPRQADGKVLFPFRRQFIIAIK